VATEHVKMKDGRMDATLVASPMSVRLRGSGHGVEANELASAQRMSIVFKTLALS
jgi:hypothetical protein